MIRIWYSGQRFLLAWSLRKIVELHQWHPKNVATLPYTTHTLQNLRRWTILIEWLHSPHLDLKTGVSSGVAVAQRRPLRSIHFMPFPTKRMRHWLKPLVSFNEHNERKNLRERERQYTSWMYGEATPGYLDSWCLQIKDLTRASSCEATY